MKEVKKCSISGVAFTMDADAYQELENYLDSLKKTYKDTPDGAEIVADISAVEAATAREDSTQTNYRYAIKSATMTVNGKTIAYDASKGFSA